ncbi:hypothetical protein DB31_5299 [Hyalangium minutum]|uniref:Uncharacterized protein n=1 Tax=Hyalangium minutum TaxID=394096 RepID=A0A085WRE4_9BACT|nr:hypothetical protein DB31_5299 [Hyalangium minutum]
MLPTTFAGRTGFAPGGNSLCPPGTPSSNFNASLRRISASLQ